MSRLPDLRRCRTISLLSALLALCAASPGFGQDIGDERAGRQDGAEPSVIRRPGAEDNAWIVGRRRTRAMPRSASRPAPHFAYGRLAQGGPAPVGFLPEPMNRHGSRPLDVWPEAAHADAFHHLGTWARSNDATTFHHLGVWPNPR